MIRRTVRFNEIGFTKGFGANRTPASRFEWTQAHVNRLNDWAQELHEWQLDVVDMLQMIHEKVFAGDVEHHCKLCNKKEKEGKEKK